MKHLKEENFEKILSDLGSLGLDSEIDQLQHIADGGMAHIYRARQPALDRYIVIKQLKKTYCGDPDLVNRFRREARCLAAVLHQNIAHVYDFIERDGDYYILMEYINGLDLSVVLKKIGKLPPRIAASILLGVCRGLHYLHSHSLIHRDVKPANIRITSRGEIKLMDLGIVMDVQDTSLTRPGILVGSPSYLSPEQILGDTVTPQSDIFLVGICLYEMLVGNRPFQDQGHETVFHRIRDAKFTPIRKMDRSIPRQLEKIAHRCLQKDPQRRYSSIKEIQKDLEKFLGPISTAHTSDVVLRFMDTEALITPTVPVTHIKELESNEVSRKWPSWIVLALLLFGAVLFGLHLGKSQSDTPKTPSNYSRPRSIK